MASNSTSTVNSEDGFKYYHYTPSMAAAGIFTALFFLTTLLHSYQMARTRTWIMIPFIIGGLMEAIGYIGRILSSAEAPDYTSGFYIMQTLLLLVAPALFAASIYMILGRIIALTEAECHSLVRQKWLTKLFVAGDILSFITQGVGGGIMGSGDQDELGEVIIIVGLSVQVLVFGLFITVGIIFHRRLLRDPTSRVRNNPSLPWQKHLFALYGTSAIIWVRSIFRLIEFAQGHNGYLLSKEVFLYVFDAALMFAVMVWLNIVHPSEVYALLKGGRYKSIKMIIYVQDAETMSDKEVV